MSSLKQRFAPCMWMRGGTSKGAFFLKKDLPHDIKERDAFLLSIMGSPDKRQIDGMGGADPLTSKVAIISPSKRKGIDVDYLFLQVFVEQALVSDKQNCGNLLAGVGPYAIERDLVKAQDGETQVRVFMENTQKISSVVVLTPNSKLSYQGALKIDGVPGSATPIALTFEDTAGSTCGSLLPSGNVSDVIDGVEVTLIDNGMPVVVLCAEDVGITGTESREQLDKDLALKTRLESIRLKAGFMMNLGDVTQLSVPKMSLLSVPINGGSVSTRTFIPHRCHASIGVLGAVSVATACLLKGSPAQRVATIPKGQYVTINVEHPIGKMSVQLDLDKENQVQSSAILRTTRKLFDGIIFAH